MTKIYKFQDDISTEALKELEKHPSLAIDTEGTGLDITKRDKLSLIQISSGNNDAYICQPNRKDYKAPNVVKILENSKITKIGHYLRYDVSGLEYFLKCEAKRVTNPSKKRWGGKFRADYFRRYLCKNRPTGFAEIA